MKGIRLCRLMMAGIAACISSNIYAHTVWLVPEQNGEWHALFGGHADVVTPYRPDKLTLVRALNEEGQTLVVTRRIAQDGVHVRISGRPSLIFASFDNGIHTKRRNGPSVEKPMNEVSMAISATRTIKFHKTIANWTPLVTRPVAQLFEVVPVSAVQPIAGRPMQLKVLVNGKPKVGIQVSRNEEGAGPVTNVNGIVNFVPQRGYNKVWAGQRLPVSYNRAYSEESIEYSFGFFAK